MIHIGWLYFCNHPFLLGGVNLDKQYLLDTNILMDSPEVIKVLAGKCSISIHTIEELDKLKSLPNIRGTRDAERVMKARRAINILRQNLDKIQIPMAIAIKPSEFEPSLEDTVDNKLLVAAKMWGLTLVTNDLNLEIKANLLGIETENYTPKGDGDGLYRGISEMQVDPYHDKEDQDLLDSLYSGNWKGVEKLHNNEYLIIKDKHTGDIIDKFRHFNGELERIVRTRAIHSVDGEIKPRNIAQQCLFDVFSRPEITIVSVNGTFGTGKSYLINNFALQELQKGNIERIVLIPNNSQTANTREQGILPGDNFDKEFQYAGSMLDLLGKIRFEEMVNQEKIEILPLAVARGRNIPNAFIIVNECQNLTEDHVLLLLGRVAEGTRIFFDGDIKQTDRDVFRNRNGLRLLMETRNAPYSYSKLFAAVTLDKIERSETAQVSAYLDSIR